MIVTYGAIGYGYTAVRCNVTVPQTEVQCLSVEGIGKNHHWIISHNIETANGGIGAVSPPSEATTSYIPPEISTIYVSNATSNHELLTAGGDVVVLNGSNFGPKGTNVVGRYQNDDNSDGRGVLLSGLMHTVPNCTVVVESTVVKCTTIPGVGAHHRWYLIVAGQASAPSSSTTSYKPPEVLAVSRFRDGKNFAAAKLLETNGSQAVYINGTNFGPATDYSSVR
jgi:hypothetical protein